jgi:hypothetical protein
MDLMRNAKTPREKEEIALVVKLDLNDKTVTDLKLDCKHAGICEITTCRDRLIKILNKSLGQKNNPIIFQSQV